MATFAVGDIHGSIAALEDLLRQLEAEVTAHDVVVFLGDYIDRGPDSRGCVESVLRFRDDVAAEVVFLCGNHEDWLLRTMHDPTHHSWLLAMDAFETVQSYSPEAAAVLRRAFAAAKGDVYLGRCALPYEAFFESMPPAHVEFFQGLLTYYKGADCVCAHGGLDPCVSELQQQPRRALIWGAEGFPGEYLGSDTVVYGHWNNAALDAEGWPAPAIIGRTIGIDTISHGVLTAVCLPDGRVFQSGRYERRRK